MRAAVREAGADSMSFPNCYLSTVVRGTTITFKRGWFVLSLTDELGRPLSTSHAIGVHSLVLSYEELAVVGY